MSSVLVFGPTGNVGSFVARTAASHGAKVWLAMRDTAKAIPGLSAEDEKAGPYQRVQADLTQPDSVGEAAKKSGAKRAFLYAAHGSPDHMKATLQALRSAGVDFVVFLSSYSVHGEDLTAITPDQVIPYIHAQIELSLADVFGAQGFVAVRPGGFATNILRHKQGIQAGKTTFFGIDFELDGVTPDDMGEVSGTILAQGPRDGQHVVYLYGPQVMTQGEGCKKVGKVLGKEVETVEIDAADAPEHFAKLGMPKPFADYMIRMTLQFRDGKGWPRTKYEEGVKNVELYAGRPALKFEDWVAKNKDLFA